jgi:hypothetical protein
LARIRTSSQIPATTDEPGHPIFQNCATIVTTVYVFVGLVSISPSARYAADIRGLQI